MKTFLLAAVAAAILTPTVASAQSAQEVRNGRQEVRRDRAEVQADLRRGDYREARQDSQELREDRRELREDWQDYRRSHASVFRRGTYTAPRGYSYRPIAVGARFAPAYYNRNYWISNPSTYRLPRASAGLQWVRYGNDVVLVNVRTGRVVQVHSRFFR